MSDIFSDAELRQVLNELPQTQPRSLWQKADAIALYLSFTGSFEAALSIWQFLFAELPREEQIRTSNQWVAPEAVCHLLQKPDFVGGEATLEVRVSQNDEFARVELTSDVWVIASEFEPPSDASSQAELEVLPSLEAFFATPGSAAFAVGDAHLLFADIAYRHNLKDEAVAHLKSWSLMMRELPSMAHQAFAFASLSRLIGEYHLEFLTQLSREERDAIARQTIIAVRERWHRGTPPKSEQTSISCGIFCSHFNVQPAFSDYEIEPPNYFEGLQEAPQGDYPREVSVATPGETGSATFHLRFAEAAPDLEKGVFAVTFPLRAIENPTRGELGARVGNVFVSSMCDADDVGFEIPIGQYDVAAIFTLGVGDKDNEEVGLRHYEVDLCFLPKGTYAKFGPHFDRSWDEE